MQNKQISILNPRNHFIIQDLGNGSSASVVLVEMRNSGEKCIIKTISESSAHEFESEVQALKSLVHPNIIRLGEENSQTRQLALEYCENNDLIDLATNIGCFPESLAKYFFLQLLKGLKYMHDSKFAHRDIKPDNLVVSSDYVLKIADFGHATRVENGQVFNRKVGTQQYAAPELINRQAYDAKKLDIYATGATIYGLVMGSFPFDEASQYDIKYRIFNSDQNKFWKFVLGPSGKSVSQEFKDLLFKMMSEDPSDRLTVDEIIAHAWFQNSWTREESISYIEERLFPTN